MNAARVTSLAQTPFGRSNGILFRHLGAAAAGSFALIASVARFGATPDAVIGAFFIATLLVLSAIDLERRILPNRIVLPAAGAVLVARLATQPDRWTEWVLAAVGASLFLLVFAVVSPGAMGLGDVKLALLLGAGLGASVAYALAIGSCAAAAYGLVLIARNGAGARRSHIAFGPFLAAGAILMLLVDAP